MYIIKTKEDIIELLNQNNIEYEYSWKKEKEKEERYTKEKEERYTKDIHHTLLIKIEEDISYEGEFNSLQDAKAELISMYPNVKGLRTKAGGYQNRYLLNVNPPTLGFIFPTTERNNY